MAKGKKRAAPAKELAMAKGKRAAPAPEVSVEVLLAQIPARSWKSWRSISTTATRPAATTWSRRGLRLRRGGARAGLWGRLFCNNVGLLSGGLDAAEAVPLWDSMSLVGPGLAKLVAWLEHEDAVDALGVRTGAYGSTYLSSAAVVGALRDLPGLRHVFLDGKQINAEIMKQRPPCLPRLRTLAVGADVNGSAPHFGKWIAAAPCLEALEAPDKLATYASLSAARHAWRDARGGGDPVLAHLKITGMERQDYRRLRRRVLVPEPRDARVQRELLLEAGWDGVPPLHPFPRLRAQSPEARDDRNHFSTAMLTELVGKLLAATPNLRAFQVRHGICYSKPPLPAPAVGRAFATLPASLRELTLSDLRIDPGDLDEANELEVLRVNACFSTGKKGPEPFRAAKFRAAWPGLKIVVDYEDEDAAA
ncbi:hypothetical protein JL722_12368 [Aureococcus anophagefferens]|nr:hypothetical protein JL722_12368 [Aureococcus anophagefferens]